MIDGKILFRPAAAGRSDLKDKEIFVLPLGMTLFRKVTIVGVGLIGGSLGLAIKKHALAREVVGLSQRQSSMMEAVKIQAVDHATHDLKKAVANSDLVVLAAPVSIINGMLSMIGTYLRRGSIVIDVGSTKASVVRAAEQHLPNHVFFVGCHPLAGSEKSGIENASADLFENSTCIMTPTEKTNRSAVEKVKRFWKKVGAETKIMPPDEHDRILAYISHLPHMLAYALMQAVSEEFLPYATPSLKELTRIAGSSPQMWNDICLSNMRNLSEGMDEAVKQMALLRKAMITHDHKTLLEYFKGAKEKREKMINGQTPKPQ